MKCLLVLGAIALLHMTLAQKQQQYTTPVPILKQINKHNEDGSYSYGYEGADGTFKIETKYADGEVYGKYGYVDDGGQVREVEYGASRRGFEPAGNDINVAPPTLRASNEYQTPLRPGEEDDGQYREDPAVYYKDEAYNTKPVYKQQPQPQYQQPQYQQPQYEQPQYEQPQYQRPKPTYRQPAPVQQYQEPEPAPVYQPRPQPVFRPQQQSSNYDFEDFRSSLGFSKTKAAPAPTAAPQSVYRPAPQPVYRPTPAPVTNYNSYNQGYSRPNNNYNNGYSNNWWSPGNNYNSGYSNNYNQRQPIAHEPLPFNVDLNTGSYSLNVGRR